MATKLWRIEEGEAGKKELFGWPVKAGSGYSFNAGIPKSPILRRVLHVFVPRKRKFERNKWLRELWRYKFNCEFDLPKDSTQNKCEAQRQSKENFNPDDKVQFVIEAVYAIAHALQAMKERFAR
uniref:Uncharacterized protein n=1 Tax=Ditylenchus dipsaci TaxID=166011 RepID=A0A915D7J5_9BILA